MGPFRPLHCDNACFTICYCNALARVKLCLCIAIYFQWHPHSATQCTSVWAIGVLWCMVLKKNSACQLKVHCDALAVKFFEGSPIIWNKNYCLQVDLNLPILYIQGSWHFGLSLICSHHIAAHVISYDTSHLMTWKFHWGPKQPWQLSFMAFTGYNLTNKLMGLVPL